MSPPALGALELAARVRRQEVGAVDVVRQALAAIRARDGALNSFTAVTEERALREARAVDAALAAGRDPGALAGVPYAVKNLFDVQGLVTLAGSRILASRPPAAQDATLVQRMQAAGAVLVGALNMDEFAYGFTTENSHYGPAHNPHDLAHVAGGSSGGSAAAVAAGLVPLSLGSDTNGSIRVPSALCGIFGLKPTFGRLSRAGAYPFVASLDHVGPFARSVADLATAYDVLQGPDGADPACAGKPREPVAPLLGQGCAGLRIAALSGYFARGGLPEAHAAVERVAGVLQAGAPVDLPEAATARAAAFVISAVEGANLHLEHLRTRLEDFDPHTRDRFLAGALVPAAWYVRAQRFRSWFRRQALNVFQRVDVLLAPATPCPAPRIGQERVLLEGQEVLVRPNLGMFTQPLSFIGLPIVTVPVHTPGALPLGVQVIAAPWREDAALRVAAELEARGAVWAPVPQTQVP